MSEETSRRVFGRPCNSGKYGEKTIPIRIPISLYWEINKILEDFVIKVKHGEKFYNDVYKQVRDKL